MKVVNDPFGNEIIVPQLARELRNTLRSAEVFDDVNTVIERPMMVFETKGSIIERYYLRAIGWHRIMMISVEKDSDGFKVTNYEIDPPQEKIFDLQKNAIQLL